MGSGVVLMAIPAVMLIIFIAMILWSLMAQPQHESAPPPAQEVLDARYALGELPHEEYIRMRSELGRRVQ